MPTPRPIPVLAALALTLAGGLLCAAGCSRVTVEYRRPAAAPSIVGMLDGRTYPPGVAVPGQRGLGTAGGLGGLEVFAIRNDGDKPVDWVAFEISYLGQGEFIHSIGEVTYDVRTLRSRVQYRGRLLPGERQECAAWVIRGQVPARALGGGVGVGSVSAGTGDAPRRCDQVAVRHFSAAALFADGKVSAEGLARFRQALGAAADGAERTALLQSLVAAVQAENRDGLPAVVQPEFVGVLVGCLFPEYESVLLTKQLPAGKIQGGAGGAGFALPSLSGEYAGTALLNLVPPRLLAEHRWTLALLAGRHPDRLSLELAAKARAAEALPRLKDWRPEWVGGDGLLRLAVLGALGDAECERQLLGAFAREKDPGRRMDMVRCLGVLATKDALKAVAEELRSTVEIRDPKAGLRRMRFEAVDALRISHPDNRLCYTPLLKTDADWEALERFCANEYGAAFKGARPPPPRDYEIILFSPDGKIHLAVPREAGN